jgi:hypothetical protein
MTAAEDIAELRRQLAEQQRQIVEMRLSMSQEDERTAALMKHWVTSEIHGQLDDRLPTKEERQHLSLLFRQAIQRAKDRNELMMHILKWGVGGGLAFFLVAGWESIKAKLGFQGGR